MTNLHEIAILTIIIRHNRVLMTSNVNVSDNCFKLKGSYIKILYIGKIQIPVCKMIRFIVGKVKNALLFNSYIIRIITIKDKIIILLKRDILEYLLEVIFQTYGLTQACLSVLLMPQHLKRYKYIYHLIALSSRHIMKATNQVPNYSEAYDYV